MRNNHPPSHSLVKVFGFCLMLLMASGLAFLLANSASAGPSAVDGVVSGQLVAPDGVEIPAGLRVALFYPDYENPSFPHQPPPPFLPPAPTPPPPGPDVGNDLQVAKPELEVEIIEALGRQTPDGAEDIFIYEEPVAVADVDVATGAFEFQFVPQGGFLLHVLPPEGSNLIAHGIPYVDVTYADIDLGSIALQQAQLHGSLFEPDGTTVANGYVHLLLADGSVGGTARSVDGRFFFNRIALGDYQMVAQPSEYQNRFFTSDPISVSVTSSDPDLTDYQIDFSGPDLYGQLLDPFGEPVYGVEVFAQMTSGPVYRSTYSDENGLWEMGDLSDGIYAIKVNSAYSFSEYLHPEPVEVAVPAENLPLLLQFSEWPVGLKTVNGQVKDTNGDLIQNGIIYAYEPEKSLRRETVLDENGEFQFNLVGGHWFFDLYPNSYEENEWVHLPLGPEVVFAADDSIETAELDIVVSRYDAIVVGSVGSGDESIPAPTYRISFYDPTTGIEVSGFYGANQPFSLKAPAGTYEYSIYSDSEDFAAITFGTATLISKETVDLGQIILTSPSATVRGRVVANTGEGIPQIDVYAYNTSLNDFTRTTQTDEDGYYEIKLVPGESSISIDTYRLVDYFYSDGPIYVVLSEDETIEGVDFVIDRLDSKVIGQLVDENGDSLPEATGSATVYAAERSFYREIFFTDGTFTMPVGEGQYHLNVSSNSPGHFIRRDIFVTVGADEDVVVAVPALLSNATIVGQIVDFRTQDPIDGLGAYVYASTSDYLTYATESYLSRRANRYEIEVRDGNWDIGWSLDSYDGRYLPVYANQNSVNVEPDRSVTVNLPVIERDATIAGDLLDPDGRPVPYGYIHLQGRGEIEGVEVYLNSSGDGKFYSDLPYGTYQVFAAGYSGSPADRAFPPNQLFITVEPGEDLRDVKIQFETASIPLTGSIFAPGLTESGELMISLNSDSGGYLYFSVGVISNGVDGVGEFTTLVTDGRWNLNGNMYAEDANWFASGPIDVDGPTYVELVLNKGSVFLTPESGELDAGLQVVLQLENGAMVEISSASVSAEQRVTKFGLETGNFLPLNGSIQPIEFNYLVMGYDGVERPVIDMAFAEPISVTIPYPETIVDFMAPEDLIIVTQSISEARSNAAPTTISDVTVNTTDRTLSFTIDHVGYFGIMAPAELMPVSPAFLDLFPNRLYLPVVAVTR